MRLPSTSSHRDGRPPTVNPVTGCSERISHTYSRKRRKFSMYAMTSIVGTPVFGFFGLGTQEIMLLLVLGVLLFGRNLPALGRSLGKTVTEFKRGVKGMEDDFEGT